MEHVIKVYLMCLAFLTNGMCFQCSQCDSDTDPHCMDDPPNPENCTSCQKYDVISGQCLEYIDMNFCIIERRYLNDTLVRMTRDCSPALMSAVCEDVVEHGEPMRVCYTTCRNNGCNQHNSATSPTSKSSVRTAAFVSGLALLLSVVSSH